MTFLLKPWYPTLSTVQEFQLYKIFPYFPLSTFGNNLKKVLKITELKNLKIKKKSIFYGKELVNNVQMDQNNWLKNFIISLSMLKQLERIAIISH